MMCLSFAQERFLIRRSVWRIEGGQKFFLKDKGLKGQKFFSKDKGQKGQKFFSKDKGQKGPKGQKGLKGQFIGFSGGHLTT